MGCIGRCVFVLATLELLSLCDWIIITVERAKLHSPTNSGLRQRPNQQFVIWRGSKVRKIPAAWRSMRAGT
jgi:hypothetical protein